MEVHTILMFMLASLSINLIPGPDVIYIVSTTMKGKRSLGGKAALGLGSGYLMSLGLLFSVLATFCNLLYASLGGFLFNRANNLKYTRFIEGISGGILVGLSAKIALAK